MKGMRWRTAGIVAAAAGILVAGGARAQTHTWTGGAGVGNGQWTDTDNWLDASAPADQTGNTIAYNDTGTSVTGIVNAAGDTWQVGAVNVNNTTGTHTLDLAGKTLALTGNLTVTPASSGSTLASATVTNGTLQLGTAASPVNLTVGTGGSAGVYYRGYLTVAPGSTLDASLTTLSVGTGGGGGGTLDLRGATVAGGTLKATTIQMGTSGWFQRTMRILLDDATEIDRIECRYFDMGYCEGHWCRIGNPDKDYKLPPDVHFLIGTPVAPGHIRMSANAGTGDSDSRIIATSGGTFTADVSYVTIGGTYGHGASRPVLDISAMSNVTLNCSGAILIPGGSTAGSTYTIQVKLPRGRVSTDTLKVGVPANSSSSALLQLNGTELAVATSAEVGIRGSVTVNVNGYSCGLDLASGATIPMTDPGKVTINFLANQNPSDPYGTYWGMRWAGDKVEALGTLRKNGQLVINAAAVAPKTAGFEYVAGENMTYVTIKEHWPPTAIAKDLYVERHPPTWASVEISVADVDAGSFDAGGGPLTNMTVTSSADETSGEPYVTFSSNGAYTVWLTVWNTNGVAGSNDCTITVGDIPAGTTASLTWDAGAALERMPRPEWLWGRNWVGDAPPVNPTSATLTFDNTAPNTRNRLDQDRQIGPLTVSSTSGTHTFDLGGRELTVAGNLLVNPSVQGTTAAAVFTNGTLQVGTPATPVTLTMGTGGSVNNGVYNTASLKLAPGSTFNGHLSTLTVGGGSSGQGTLDLRGATVAGGVLKATTIEMGTGGHFQRSQSILLDGATGLGRIECRYLDMGTAQGHVCRIGDLAGNLPPNVDIVIGSVGALGRLRMSTASGTGNGNSRLAASSGGTFTASMSAMTIGSSYSHGTTTAVLDLSAMNSLALACSGAVEIPGGATSTGGYGVTVKLPPGTASAASLSIGAPDNPSSTGLLELNGTTFAVGTAATIGARGTLTVNVGDVSRGLDLAEAATLAIAAGRTLQINFTTPPADLSEGHWGLRWGGDKVTELRERDAAGTIAWDDDALGGKVDIFLFRGDTHIGIPPPRGSLMLFR